MTFSTAKFADFVGVWPLKKAHSMKSLQFLINKALLGGELGSRTKRSGHNELKGEHKTRIKKDTCHPPKIIHLSMESNFLRTYYLLNGMDWKVRYIIGNVGITSFKIMLTLFESRYTLKTILSNIQLHNNVLLTRKRIKCSLCSF